MCFHYTATIPVWAVTNNMHGGVVKSLQLSFVCVHDENMHGSQLVTVETFALLVLKLLTNCIIHVLIGDTYIYVNKFICNCKTHQ